MANLVLGPMLRYVGETEATVWMEADAACEVEVLGRRARTFAVGEHHFAIVALTGLEPGTTHEYAVALDGVERWPPANPALPPSAVRTVDPRRPLHLRFGSCRAIVPAEGERTAAPDDDGGACELDALLALAQRLVGLPREEWPDLLMMLGDQVYGDECDSATLAFVRGRRDTVHEAPYDGVADFEEYARLYQESWSEPTLRWMLSTVGSAMVFDDHDVQDDWNISQGWLSEMEDQPWWRERIVGALMAFWLYQHLGNLSPAELEADDLLRRMRAAEGDAEPLLREQVAARIDRRDGTRWSHARTLGRTRLVFPDTRQGRCLQEGRRDVFDDAEWAWLGEQVRGDFDHVVLAESIPLLMPPALHFLEAWNDAVCAGAWGRLGQRLLGERVRRRVDLEHWSAFRTGFERFAAFTTALARGAFGPAPATVVHLAGDIHHAYVAEVALPKTAGATSTVVQAVSSPFRNELTGHEQTLARAGSSRAGIPVTRLLARAAGVPDPPLRWRLVQPPTFDNQIGTLEIADRRASVRLERAVEGVEPGGHLQTTLHRRIA